MLRRRFSVLLLTLLALTAVRYALQIDIPRAIFLALIFLIVLFGDQNEIIAMVLCCIPLHESIDFFYSLFICLVVYVFKYFRRIRLNSSVILILAGILWELLHSLNADLSIISFLSAIIPLIVLAIIMCSDLSELDYPFLVRAFAMTTFAVFLTLLTKVLYLSGFNVVSAIAGLQRLGLDTQEASQSVTVSGGEINPNTLGIIGILAVTGLLQIRHMGQGRRMDMPIVCALMVFGSLTASRTYLVCLVFVAILVVLGGSGSFRQKLRLLGLFVILVAAALLILQLCFPALLKYYIGRFFVRDITTGRADLLTFYGDFILSNPDVLCFGIGLQDFEPRLIELYRVASVVPHNAFQEIIIAWGVPGLFFFAALFVCMYHSAALFQKRQTLLNAIPLLLLLFKSMAGQLLTSPYTMLALSYAWLSLCVDLTPGANTRISPRPAALRSSPGKI